MFRRVVMLRCVFSDGRIAAAYVGALRAETEMDPALAGLQTLFASMFFRAGEVNCFEM